MVVDIRGINTHNKGAHLMLLAVAERLGGTFTLSASPNGTSYDVRARLGLRQTAVLNQAPLPSALASDLIPAALASSFGIARDRDITGVVDAAGFAYSDSFSADRSIREAKNAKRWTKRGATIVALPQAFGPFEKPDVRQWSARYLQSASLVFARDKQSLRFLREVAPEVDSRLSPDFTLALRPAAVERPRIGPFAALVPNGKLVSHTSMSLEGYVSLLADAGQAFRSAGVEPIIVTHEFGDRAISQRLGESLGAEVVESDDPLVLKAYLGQAAFAVASRFHALVSALAQGTPSIALGWSHKYAALLDDFDAREWIFSPGDDIRSRVEQLMAADSLPLRLAQRAAMLKVKNEEMWELTEATLAGS